MKSFTQVQEKQFNILDIISDLSGYYIIKHNLVPGRLFVDVRRYDSDLYSYYGWYERANSRLEIIPTVERKEETRWVTFELNDKQVLDKANKATVLNTKIEDLNAQEKRAADDFKGKIQVATTELNEIFAIISSTTLNTWASSTKDISISIWVNSGCRS